MVKAFADKEVIALDLLNQAGNASSVANIFNQGTMGGIASNTASVVTNEVVAVVTGDLAAGSWTLIYEDRTAIGTPIPVAFSVAAATIDSLVAGLNSAISTDDYWYYVEVSAGSWNVYVSSNRYVFTSIQGTGAPMAISDATFQTISGTSVTPTVRSSGVTYEGLVQAFSTQPYFLESLYLAAGTFSQAQETIEIVTKDKSGKTFVDLQKPTISAMVRQFVKEFVPLYLTSSALSYIGYTVEASGTVSLIIKYRHASRFDLAALVNEEMFEIKIREMEANNDIERLKFIQTQLKEVDSISKELKNRYYASDGNQPAPPKKEKIIFSTNPLINLVEKKNPSLARRVFI